MRRKNILGVLHCLAETAVFRGELRCTKGEKKNHSSELGQEQVARRKELVIKNARRFRHVYRRAISLVTKEKVDVKSLGTHRFDLSRLPEAFELVAGRREGVIKAVIEMGRY